ncbi:hypothetical protein JJB11_10755 [Ramlibacter ginsenosidimutans]|uniref:Uncharacterized protein n=1 Tax=Ramlibacter ginsenosidimutans TaxID=502333 RepID=A0A934WMV6_9BURK|nr:hypothetical protein [Ramlibacter ginsenosidimutans]MBK6006572.1 hypothetical protein [Ramlibacter ginsenosidimutans]
MMRASRPHEQRPRLMPEGRRWGFGAHSLVPYLTAALSARPGDDALLASIRNPVFTEMDRALRALPQRD